jgi:hypothetical protein
MPKCVNGECPGQSGDFGSCRGVCGACYGVLARCVRQGKWSWKELEDAGRCLPARKHRGSLRRIRNT